MYKIEVLLLRKKKTMNVGLTSALSTINTYCVVAVKEKSWIYL